MASTALADEARIEAFIAKYSSEVGATLRDSRQHLRGLFPRGYELVFDNYNALVIGVSPSERSSDAFLSVAGYPRWVNLFFLRGVELKDPAGLLQGSGSQVRCIRLQSAAQLSEPAVQALIAQATAPHRAALLRCAPLQTIIKSVSGKQRPRKPVQPAARSRKAA